MGGNTMGRISKASGGLRSAKMQMKDMKAHQLPNDMGLIGEAKVLPPFKDQLSLLFKHPVKLFWLIYIRGKFSIGGWYS